MSTIYGSIIQIVERVPLGIALKMKAPSLLADAVAAATKPVWCDTCWCCCCSHYACVMWHMLMLLLCHYACVMWHMLLLQPLSLCDVTHVDAAATMPVWCDTCWCCCCSHYACVMWHMLMLLLQPLSLCDVTHVDAVAAATKPVWCDTCWCCSH